MKQVLCAVLCISFLYSQQFTKITTGALVNDGGDSRSVNWIDYDNDGDLDLFVSNGPSAKANNFLYKNNGDGTFTKVTDVSVVNDAGSYDGSTWADYDNDGNIDVYTATWYGQKNSLHRQYKGSFEKVTRGEIANDLTYSETASWGDYDNDGYVDLYLANSAGNKANNLYKNNGDGTFTKMKTGIHVTEERTSRSVDWSDFDNDGDLDLFVANEGGENNSLYKNLGNGNFESITNGAIVTDGGDSFGSSVADIDNDGDLDVFVANHSNENDFLYKNNGDGTFMKITSDPVATSGGYSVGSAFGDIDNDGDLDLFITNAFSGNSQAKNLLFLNNGSGTFIKIDTGIVVTDLGWSYGVGMGDYDRDGDLDIFTANCFGASQNNSLYRNNGNANAWLTVKTRGTVSNASGIGTKVKVKAIINGNAVWQYRQVAGQSGYCGQNLESHFGLGNASTIDSLIVLFPSGQKVIQTNISPNQVLTIKEPLPSGYLRGALQMSTFEGMSPLTIHFNDISVSDSAHPVQSWQWDFDGNGSIDSTAASPSFTYSVPDTYSVMLIVSNGVTTDTVIAKDAIIITQPTAIIQFSTTMHNFGTIDVNTSSKDTTMYIFNYGKVTDSIVVSLIYGSTVVGTIKPDSALSVTPHSFTLAPDDSQAITFTVFPPRVIRTNLNITYSPKVVITSKYNGGQKVFEKLMAIKLQGTLTEVKVSNSTLYDPHLHQNYPNPFNPATTIKFSLSHEADITVKLFDAVGKELATLANGKYSEGEHSITMNAHNLASGVYYYILNAGTFREVKKLTVVK